MSNPVALSLYRQMLRESRVFQYNLRHYIQRRSRYGFEQGRNLSGADQEKALAEAKAQLEIIKRQVSNSMLAD